MIIELLVMRVAADLVTMSDVCNVSKKARHAEGPMEFELRSDYPAAARTP